MAKDDRQILHGIRSGIAKGAEGKDKSATTYKAGMEDELAAALSQEELDAAVERGDLAGTWKHISKAKAEKAAEKAKES
jgi:hypothetical protein